MGLQYHRVQSVRTDARRSFDGNSGCRGSSEASAGALGRRASVQNDQSYATLLPEDRSAQRTVDQVRGGCTISSTLHRRSRERAQGKGGMEQGIKSVDIPPSLKNEIAKLCGESLYIIH